ncbi:hypothetical protein FPHYL_4808 [Fusarium phyllophilum]|uniref:Uncharacterized protein n=1 Tax=Fusarium phyllophilum TaxID=47803 RepID=A0A8H5K214_9HYPO|nr:hypothetical protein FPHYL_4808 [Fusarium phyllophilum]
MAGFARTIKSPYLSPRLRPSMPSRSMSTNSDQAQANPPPPQSPRSGEIIGEFDLSGRNTPAIPSNRPTELQDGFFDLDDIEPRTSCFSVSDLNLPATGRRGYPPADDPGRRRAVLNPAAGIASCKKLRGETRSSAQTWFGATNSPQRTQETLTHGISSSCTPPEKGLGLALKKCTTGFCFKMFLYPVLFLNYPVFDLVVIDPPFVTTHSVIVNLILLTGLPFLLTYVPSLLDDNERSAPGTPSAPPSAPSTPRSRSHVRPIAIDLPQIRRFTSTPARTPPEPLSARGDLPGGYFPLHEDPNSRVHRPHPFQHHPDTRMSRLISESGPIYADSPTSHPAQSAIMSHSNTPVASYLAPGFHEHPVPMGKYYPSNYERRNGAHSVLRPPLSGSVSSNVGSDSSASSQSKLDGELRCKLLQYKRDMVTQTSMAANELIGSSAKSGNKPGLSLNDLPFRDSRFATPSYQKPLSPRLLPIRSPGPITPMELEKADAGDYMSR